jgi:hypothetical protein
MTFFPFVPVWLLVLLAVAAVTVMVIVSRRKSPVATAAQSRALIILRWAALALLFLVLLNPGRLTEDRNLDKSHIVFLLDDSSSMATRDMPYGQTRWQRLAEALKAHPFKRLADYPVDCYFYNEKVEAASFQRLAEKTEPHSGTDLRKAVDAVNRDIGLNRVSALVVCSDGVDASGFRGSEVSAPIYAVQFGTDLAKVRDLAVGAFRFPDKVAVDETVTLDIPLLLTQSRAASEKVKCVVELDGTALKAFEPALAGGRAETERVSFTLKTPGVHFVTIRCDTLPEEATELNNRRELAIEAVEAQTAIVAYFPVLNTSFRPLLREFLKAGAPPFTGLCKIADGSFSLQGREPDKRFADGLPKRADELRSVSVLILGAHSRERLSASEAFTIEQYVQGGGALICLAGTDAYGHVPEDSPMLRMLPVVPPDEPAFLAGRFTVKAADGASGGFLTRIREMAEAQKGDADFILSGINTVKDVKANAEVLLWAESGERYPLVVVQPYGRGKVIALLSNAFHLWGAPDKREGNFSAFWRQLVAYAGASDDEADLLTLALAKTEIPAGETVELTAKTRRPANVATNAALTLDAEAVATAGGKAAGRKIVMKNTGPLWTGELAGLEKGRYLIKAVLSVNGQPVRTRCKALWVGESPRESEDVRSTRERFGMFCAEKNLFAPDQLDGLENALRDAVRKNVVQREESLVFEHPIFLGALLALLFTGWILRRVFNLF